jgi:hypothetical protein
VLLEPWDDVRELEDGAVGGADRILEGLERERAEAEGETAEGDGGFGLETLRGAEAVS